MVNFSSLEYNPKLSEASKGTRVAYVKFMARALKDNPKGVVQIVDEKQKTSEAATTSGNEILLKPNLKSIIVRRYDYCEILVS